MFHTHTIFAVLGIITFIYSLVLVFGMDSGISSAKISNGFSSILPYLVWFAFACGIGLVLFL